MKIAPNLSHALEYMGNQYQSEYAKSLVTDARAEFRALLAVARAARTVINEGGMAAQARLDNALARLEKVSGRKP